MLPVRLMMVAAAILTASLLKGQEPPAVVLAGTPASLERGFYSSELVCRDFDVYGDGKAKTAMISTQGLGRALLSGPGRAGFLTLLRIPIGTTATTVRLCIPVDAFPEQGTVKGKIVAIAAATTAEAPVSLSGSETPLAKFFAALLWGLGFAVPALLSTYLGQHVYLWQKRKEAAQKLVQVRAEHNRTAPEAEKTLFENYLPRLKGASDKQFASDISDQLASLEGLLADDDMVAMKSALDDLDRMKVLDILQRNFPNRKSVLDSLRSKE